MADNPQMRVPLASLIESRNFSASQDSKMVNCFVEQTSGNGLACVKRPGLSLAFQGAVGCGQGIVNFLEVLYSISADILNINATVTSGFTQTTAAAGWAGRTGMMGVGFNGKLWAMGGRDAAASTFYNDVYRSTDGINWTLVTAAAGWTARGYAGIVVFNSLMWIMGGQSATGDKGDVWYSSDGVTWTQATASAWGIRRMFGITSFNSKMWVAGGQVGTANFYNDVWSSSDGVTWVRATNNAPWVARSRLGFIGFNGKLRVLGGQLSTEFIGAGGDLWSSTDGVTWARDSSNPFGQAGTGVFGRVAMTSIGAVYGLAPAVTLTGGGGAGATAITFVNGMEEDGAEDFDTLLSVAVTAAGAAYTSAPTVAIVTGAGVPATGHSFLNANGVLGDKRGTLILAGTTIYFFTSTNNGLDTSPNEIWQSTNGTTWTIFAAAPAYGPRDTTAFYLGSFWILSGTSGGVNYTDVWKSSISSSSQLALTPTTTCLPFSFSQTSSTLTNPLLFFKTTKDAYTYNANLASLVKVSDVDYPATTVPGIAYLDTFFFVMDPQGRIWNSAVNDPTNWTALGMIPMQGEPNGGVALGKVGNYVVALGVWSTQFFYDAAVASPASPLAVNLTLDSLVGCASGDSLVQMQSTMVWLGQNKSEGRGVFMISNLIPQRISTPFIDRILEADTLTSVRAFATVAVGHSLYVLTLINTNITLVYDFMDKIWYVWTSHTDRAATVITSLTVNPYGLATAVSAGHGNVDGDPVGVSGATVGVYNGDFNISLIDTNTFSYMVPAGTANNSGTAQATGSTEGYFIGRGSASLGGTYYIQHETNGGVYQSSPNIYDDFGNAIDVRTRTTNWDGGTSYFKTVPNIALIADIVSSKCVVRYTNNDYNNFSKYRLVDLSIVRPHLTRNGRTRRRAWELRHTAATAFRAYYIEIDPEGGTY